MKLYTWSATPAGRRISVSGTDGNGERVTLDDVKEIVNDMRSGRTYAVTADDEEIEL